MEQLTILSFGAGQDSTCILYKIILDPAFRTKYVQGKLLMVMSDTGNEHPHTYRHVAYIAKLFADTNIPFVLIKSSMGFHPWTWPSLQEQYAANDNIMSLMFPRTCTDNLKIRPIYNFIDDHIGRHYFGHAAKKVAKGKRFIKRFVAERGPIRVILGISAGEEGRIKRTEHKRLKATQLELFRKPQRRSVPLWMENCIDKIYPLVETGMDRKACQQYIRSTGLALPYPSNCMMCPFISKPELLWLYRNIPHEFYQWAAYERRKIDKNAARKTNHGVKGAKMLEEILQEAISEFGHLSDQQLNEYKMSHGHCVRSSF